MKTFYLFLILSLAFNNMGLYQVTEVNIIPEEPKVQTKEPLKIICPKCGYVLYVCEMDEIFEDDLDYIQKCSPTSHLTKTPSFGTQAPVCPLDGGYAFVETKNLKEEVGVRINTNKGWMPKRFRPY